MAKKLKYGLIGSGGCGVRKHLAAYALYKDDVEMVAVCDIVPAHAKQAAAQYDIPQVYTDYREMLKKAKLDFISVATPNYLHAPIAIAALHAGIHVHTEKPIALNAEQAQAMVDAKNASGSKLLVGLNNRYTETSMFAKRYVDNGLLGDVYLARCGWRRRRGTPGRGSWFTQKAQAGGGPLIDLGVHFFDLTMFFLGYPAPRSVSASTYSAFINEPPTVQTEIVKGTTNLGDPNGVCDVEDLATGFVKLENGASVAFEFSWASNVEREWTYLELMGTKGGLTMHDGELKIFSESTGALVDIVPQIKNTSAWGENEARHFIKCIREDVPMISPPEEAVTMMRIIDGAYASAASGHEVVLTAAAT